jgi:hypothetical protein
LALSPDAARVWTQVLGTLAAAEPVEACGGGQPRAPLQASPPASGRAAGAPRGGGRAAAAAAAAGRQQLGRTGVAPPEAWGDELGLPRGALRFTKRLGRLIVSTGDIDLLYNALTLLDKHGQELQVA